MSVKARLFLAKLLIVFSVILILCGGILQIRNNRVLHPVDDVRVVAGVDSEVISVTTVDDSDVFVPITGGSVIVPELVIPGNNSNGNVNVQTPVVSPTPSVSPTPNITPSPSPSVIPSPSQSPIVQPSPSPSPSPEIEVPVQTSIDDVNLQLRSSIQTKYGITVKYGSETSGYSVGGMSTTMLPDAETANAALNNLEQCLALYPDGFFQEIRDGGYPLTIYLIKRYSTANVTGVTDSSNQRIVISVATDYDFADTLHHEVYHYIEKYIFTFGFRFTSWNTLNPEDFSYGTVNSDYSYARTFSEDAYFVNNYAQTDQYEDRASTFEYMMKSSKISCLNNGKTVWLKARTMCEQIDYFLESVNSYTTEYWERHIY